MSFPIAIKYHVIYKQVTADQGLTRIFPERQAYLSVVAVVRRRVLYHMGQPFTMEVSEACEEVEEASSSQKAYFLLRFKGRDQRGTECHGL